MNPDEPLRTKNLVEEDPAPMDDTLAGYPWLPRMIDKARAAASGSLGSYFKYPCPIDSHCLGLLGLDAAIFQRIAVRARCGRAVLSALQAEGAKPAADASFDPLTLNAEFHSDTS